MVKNLPENAEDVGSIPGWGRSPGKGNDNPLQYSWLENTKDKGAWWSIVHGQESQTQLSRVSNNNSLYKGQIHGCSHTGTCAQKGLTVGLRLCCHHLEIHNNFWTRSSTFLFWPGLHKLLAGPVYAGLSSRCTCAKLLQLCPTLCHPMDSSPPDSSVHGILQSRTLEWVAMPSSRTPSWPRD